MAQLKQFVLLGFLILTVVFVKRSTAAACTDASVCLNGGTCPDTANPCVCVNGFTGDTCSTAPVCSVNDDCKNGGTCNTNTYTCDCGSYKGANCQNACAANGDCDNGGTCKMDASPYVCQCTTGYTGAMCTEKSSASTLKISLLAVIALLAAFLL